MVEKKAVFLDRDGVLNYLVKHKDGTIGPPPSYEYVLIPGDVPLALDLLRKAGYLLVVVTNQPDVARGSQTRKNVEKINETIALHLHLNHFFVCYHDDKDECECRKPRPGLIEDAAAALGIDSRKSFMIGDRRKDIDAGRTAGCKTILLFNKKTYDRTGANFIVDNLSEAVDLILEQEKEDE